jgi:hypothetical protein
LCPIIDVWFFLRLGVPYTEEAALVDEQLACQKCDIQAASRPELKIHYLEAHYKHKLVPDRDLQCSPNKKNNHCFGPER